MHVMHDGTAIEDGKVQRKPPRYASPGKRSVFTAIEKGDR